MQRQAHWRGAAASLDDQLQELCEFLELELSGRDCDHTLGLIRHFLAERGFPAERILAWLDHRDSPCDCKTAEALAEHCLRERPQPSWASSTADSRERAPKPREPFAMISEFSTLGFICGLIYGITEGGIVVTITSGMGGGMIRFVIGSLASPVAWVIRSSRLRRDGAPARDPGILTDLPDCPWCGAPPMFQRERRFRQHRNSPYECQACGREF